MRNPRRWTGWTGRALALAVLLAASACARDAAKQQAPAEAAPLIAAANRDDIGVAIDAEL